MRIKKIDFTNKISQVNKFLDYISTGQYLSAAEKCDIDCGIDLIYTNDATCAANEISNWGKCSCQKCFFENLCEPKGWTLFYNLVCNKANIVEKKIHGNFLLDFLGYNKLSSEYFQIFEKCYSLYFDKIYCNINSHIKPQQLEWLSDIFECRAKQLFWQPDLPYNDEVSILCNKLFAGYLPLELDFLSDSPCIKLFYGDYGALWKELN